MMSQVDVLVEASLLNSFPLQKENHTSLNSSQGVVSTTCLDGMLDKEM
jgi:hypothetical protein